MGAREDYIRALNQRPVVGQVWQYGKASEVIFPARTSVNGEDWKNDFTGLALLQC